MFSRTDPKGKGFKKSKGRGFKKFKGRGFKQSKGKGFKKSKGRGFEGNFLESEFWGASPPPINFIHGS